MSAVLATMNASPWATCPDNCTSTEIAIRGVLNELFVGLAAVFMLVIFGIAATPVDSGADTAGRTAALVILMLLALACAGMSMSSQGVQLARTLQIIQPKKT